MEIKEAVEAAKAHVQSLFGSENITHLGLEEVELVDDQYWNITIGFFRPWDLDERSRTIFSQFPRREYKVVLINDHNGSIESVKNHAVMTAR